MRRGDGEPWVAAASYRKPAVSSAGLSETRAAAPIVLSTWTPLSFPLLQCSRQLLAAYAGGALGCFSPLSSFQFAR